MNKSIITISVDNDATNEEINEIRSIFKKEGYSNNYKLNVIKSGEDNMELSLSRFLAARLKS